MDTDFSDWGWSVLVRAGRVDHMSWLLTGVPTFLIIAVGLILIGWGIVSAIRYGWRGKALLGIILGVVLILFRMSLSLA